MLSTKIKGVYSRELLDSRGNPTVEATVVLENGLRASAISPSGASTGKFEAVELRDNERERYRGKGVRHACENINVTINKVLTGMDIFDQTAIDNKLIDADGSEDKHVLGANATLAVSLAAAKLAAAAGKQPLYRYIGGTLATSVGHHKNGDAEVHTLGTVMPVPMMNILNGGAHAANNLDIQEFMIMPVGAETFSQAVRWCSEVYHTLAELLKKENLSVGVGDEGGFAPNLEDDEQAFSYIIKAIEKAGYQMHKHFMLAVDGACSEWVAEGKKDTYTMPKKKRNFTSDELVEYWCKLCDTYPIASLEDPMGEEDYDGWQKLTATIGANHLIVGDDLFVTNPKRLQMGFDKGLANTILIKPNQIGTLTETLETIKLARNYCYKTILSHRSGESEDTSISDIAVAVGAGYIKSGAPARSERVAKYNQLLRIEEEILNGRK